MPMLSKVYITEIAISGKKKGDSAINDRQIAENLLHPLSWTHIQRIIRVVDPKARDSSELIAGGYRTGA
jgi:hypothetical protein